MEARSSIRSSGFDFVVVCTLLCFIARPVAADATFFSLQSRALGGGQFEYTLSGGWNVFFTNFYDVAVGFDSFTGRVAWGQTAGAAVTNYPAGTNYGEGIEYQWPGTSPRSFTHVLTPESSLTNVQRNRAYAMFAAVPSQRFYSPYVTANIVGYCSFNSLVPSAVPDPGVSNLALFGRTEIISDPKVVEIRADSISCAWSTNYTMRIESSFDGFSWSVLGHFYQSAVTTTWTSATALSEHGRFFRVGALQFGRNTNLVTNSAASILHSVQPSSPTVPVTKCVPNAGGGTELTFPSDPGDAYRAVLAFWDGTVLSEATVTATGSVTTVRLSDGATESPVLTQVYKLTTP